MQATLVEKDVFLLEGREGGPRSVVLAGVHGDEMPGIEAFERLLPTLEIQRGKVWFIYANPVTMALNRRVFEANLNRMFKSDEEMTKEQRKSYEYERAQFLKPYLEGAEVLLDIHASTTPTGKPKPFVLCEANAKGIIEYLPFNVVVNGFDEVEPGGTDYYMNKIGKIGICVECGFMTDPEASLRAEESILNFLKVRGHMEGEVSMYEQRWARMYTLYLTKVDFRPAKEFEDFEPVVTGQVLGTDGEEDVTAPRAGFVLFPREREGSGKEAFLFGEWMS
ncbi:MAG: hypothetical protein COT89_00485 [Candidatus Colwellbacteria bacterium CG10_big_fil_rev_8_21_14_0_10_42_22]|uniref:Succinylglutamate desuccinylase/Aspartoacylase catalytic domain-containing protein n=1 Tax=Candidatus Colwellbacteria bacterium CG10_big_fil_rev_8_21_14_0_10_42_22 TaxID=1974540 RepID=A0A2H0VGG7_9BACT|nr:MAG: hypothetical protein COT89_00485 [Candidatus Colwellbacteria bacterium CG10_big_fil_rev_8_21_14_0_10_42_22]